MTTTDLFVLVYDYGGTLDELVNNNVNYYECKRNGS